MSGERRGWLLPVIVVALGSYFLVTGMRNGTLTAVHMKPVNWAGIALMAAGLVTALMQRSLGKLAGVLLAGIGAILVICL